MCISDTHIYGGETAKGRGCEGQEHFINHKYMCNELRGIMARSTQFPGTITRSTIIYDILSPGAAGLSIYI